MGVGNYVGLFKILKWKALSQFMDEARVNECDEARARCCTMKTNNSNNSKLAIKFGSYEDVIMRGV